MVYLLDANSLIDANRDYYPIGRVPEYWEWLTFQAEDGNVKIPIEIYEEIKQGNDDLAKWVKKKHIKQALLLDLEADPALVAMVVNECSISRPVGRTACR